MSPDLLWLAVSLTIWGIGEGMFLLFQPVYLQQLGADPVQIGFILGAVGVAMSLAHLPAGHLADRFGRRQMLILAWCLATIATWIMALASSLPGFVVGSALYGLTAFVASPMNSYVTAARGKWTTGRALTFIGITYNLGAIIGPFIGGWIAQYSNLRNSFFFAGSLFIISFLSLLRTRSQPIEEAAHQRFNQAISRVLTPRYFQFLIIIFLAVFAMYLPQPLSQNFLQNERGISSLFLGFLIAMRGAGVVINNLVLGRLNARLGFIIAQINLAIAFLLLWLGANMGWYLGAYFLIGSYFTARSLAAAQGKAFVPANSMGLAYGLLEMIFALAAIIAPPIAGLIYRSNPSSVYTVGLVCMAVVIITSLFWLPTGSHEQN